MTAWTRTLFFPVDSRGPVGTCRWFALCDRPAVGVVAHPVRGDVPTCHRCATKLGLDLRPRAPS